MRNKTHMEVIESYIMDKPIRQLNSLEKEGLKKSYKERTHITLTPTEF